MKNKELEIKIADLVKENNTLKQLIEDFYDNSKEEKKKEEMKNKQEEPSRMVE